MAKGKLTQKQAIFYRLYQAFKDNPGHYIPVHEFMGEIYAKEVGLWGYVSYECSARASEMVTSNPHLIESTKLTGRSGAKYNGYRIKLELPKGTIPDPSLVDFYNKIKRQPSLPTIPS